MMKVIVRESNNTKEVTIPTMHESDDDAMKSQSSSDNMTTMKRKSVCAKTSMKKNPKKTKLTKGDSNQNDDMWPSPKNGK